MDRCTCCGADLSGRRSPSQSRKFHAYCGLYAAQLGEEPEQVKILMKYWFGVWETVPWPNGAPDWKGMPAELAPPYVLEPVVVFLKSESEYTKLESSRLIRGTASRCIEAGVDVEGI